MWLKYKLISACITVFEVLYCWNAFPGLPCLQVLTTCSIFYKRSKLEVGKAWEWSCILKLKFIDAEGSGAIKLCNRFLSRSATNYSIYQLWLTYNVLTLKEECCTYIIFYTTHACTLITQCKVQCHEWKKYNMDKVSSTKYVMYSIFSCFPIICVAYCFVHGLVALP